MNSRPYAALLYFNTLRDLTNFILNGTKKITKLETVMGTTNDKPEMNLVADIFNSSAYQSIVLAAKTVIIIKDIQ